MKKKSAFILCSCLFISGCYTSKPLLVVADREKIFSVAKQELLANCPEFVADQYNPGFISWRSSGDNENDRIYVTFVGRDVSGTTVWSTDPSNGRRQVVLDHRTATVCLSNRGKLLDQAPGEVVALPALTKVWYTEPTTNEAGAEGGRGSRLLRKRCCGLSALTTPGWLEKTVHILDEHRDWLYTAVVILVFALGISVSRRRRNRVNLRR